MSNENSGSCAKADQEAKHSFLYLFLTIFIPFGLGHFVSYLFRTVNALIYADLERELLLPASSLGLLTGVYFLTFAAAQIPLGVMLDRYGPRSVQAPMLLFAVLGSLIFSFSHTELGLIIGRGLIGLGVAGSLMSAIKACAIWLPAERLPLSTACLLSVGGLGAMASTTPLHELLKWITWREAFLILALLTLFVCVVIHRSVPRTYKPKHTTLGEMSKAVGTLYSSWVFWRLALYSVFAHAIYMSVLSLWMGPWLRDVAHLDESSMAQILLWGTVAMVAGSLAFGSITDYLRRFGVQPIMVCGGGVSIFIAFQLLMISGLPVSPLLIAMGFSFFGTSTTMNYAIVAQSVSPELAGRVSSSFNLVVFVLAFVLQWLMGEILNLWPASGQGHPVEAYRWSLGVMIALQVPGVLLWLSFKPWELKIAVAR
ncbi:MFS transporter [Pseudomonas umsongensis]|jgi:MFS family permease|uniref:MFS transporter n=1 Tax=Pseudomonas umsongensis TaxID=198618 RepID=A0ABX4E3Q6_9PSED|nr:MULTISPECIES: MFS transporter [Pseudomonas]KEX92824.1 MFS transporter [Pseudomonas putida]EPA96891.1 major facilitator transporter [Pseudomonas sp. G5(2012)]MBT9571058.1 MFS transporter [Pseudomonas umsongensis]OXR36117.1 MFS transporter [Pseudomonas umsongensis]QFG31337.1 MFS transporter [Pseudomonas umsongensis]